MINNAAETATPQREAAFNLARFGSDVAIVMTY
jgi:hypothetical protein